MTITTKYNIGDKVWAIVNDKVQECVIVKFHIDPDYSNQLSLEERIKWQLDVEDLRMFTNVPASRFEEQLFPTKEELLKSL